MKKILSSVLLALMILSSVLLGHTDALAQDHIAPRADPPTDNTVVAAPRAEASSATSSEEEIGKLKAALADQQKRIEQLEQRLDDQRRLIEQALHVSSATGDEERTIPPASVQPADVADASSVQPPIAVIQKTPDDQTSPLSIRIGKVSVTPYGFLDLTTIIRDKNVGSGLSTNFGNIPFSNTVSGQLSEFRFTAQNSRLGARFDVHHGDTDFLGLIETDFAGFSPGNVAVTTNSNSLRIRLGWVDFRKSKWEILGGQSWSLLTPNRRGTSPIPADIFSTQNIDQSIQVGLTWARAPQFRVIYHATQTVTFAVSLEAAEQYGGGSAGAGEITLPAALASSYAPQLNLGESTFGAPNLHPDVIAKLAFDPKVGSRDLHLEVAGMWRGFRFYNPEDQTKHYAAGGGVLVGLNYEAARNFRLIFNGFYSNGGGRYILGLGPDVVINADGSPSLVHSASTVTGIEYQGGDKNLFDAYYGGAYIYRASAIDSNGQLIGYGYAGSPDNHNRSLQQFTLGYTRTFWRDPNYGALQLISQYSYVVRNPWSIPPGQPGSAHTNFLYFSIRYFLPGAPPARTGQ
jgi:hypothetical protein